MQRVVPTAGNPNPKDVYGTAVAKSGGNVEQA